MSARKLKKGKETLSLSDAVWQYFIDHALPTNDNRFVFQFGIIKDKEDLISRIQARQAGWYRFTEEQIKNKKPIKKRKTGWRRHIRRWLHNLGHLI